jgi:hypothetical protein
MNERKYVNIVDDSEDDRFTGLSATRSPRSTRPRTEPQPRAPRPLRLSTWRRAQMVRDEEFIAEVKTEQLAKCVKQARDVSDDLGQDLERPSKSQLGAVMSNELALVFGRRTLGIVNGLVDKCEDYW